MSLVANLKPVSWFSSEQTQDPPFFVRVMNNQGPTLAKEKTLQPTQLWVTQALGHLTIGPGARKWVIACRGLIDAAVASLCLGHGGSAGGGQGTLVQAWHWF